MQAAQGRLFRQQPPSRWRHPLDARAKRGRQSSGGEVQEALRGQDCGAGAGTAQQVLAGWRHGDRRLS
eukprot:4743848-Pyramimonas_sp.AAC.1